ncbi:hypothetical protein Taro_053183 [Colocasia esculenta]|uniref:Uncharacterized protein n=1 Tax=Colocasia esculenta TaxID=4460 RepID=A0A843XK83_COLES|nr:hypothetical protein [Colocasia esculenta]
MSQADLTVEQGKAACPMLPSGLLKATGPMSPSQFQRVKCPSREHKPQFVSLLGEDFSSGELGLGDSVGAWEEALVFSCKEREVLGSWEEARGSSELGGPEEGSLGVLHPDKATPLVSLPRWRHIDASPSGTPEGDSTYVASLVATWGPSPSAYFLFPISAPVSLADLSGETSQQFPPRHSEEMGPQ